jgi:hypothetical protein
LIINSGNVEQLSFQMSADVRRVLELHHSDLIALAPESPLNRGASRDTMESVVDALAAEGDALVRASAQTESAPSIVTEELNRRHAEREARERALQQREAALLAAVEEEEREWVKSQQRLDEELARQREALRLEQKASMQRRAALDDSEAYRKLAMLVVFVVAAFFVVLHHTSSGVIQNE